MDRTGPVELAVSGMTCGSCATRVQKALSRHQGVEDASVNFATKRATVQLDPDRVEIKDLVAAVAKAGYGLAPISASSDTDAEESEDKDRSMWLRRVLVAWPLGIIALVLSVWFMEDPCAHPARRHRRPPCRRRRHTRRAHRHLPIGRSRSQLAGPLPEPLMTIPQGQVAALGCR